MTDDDQPAGGRSPELAAARRRWIWRRGVLLWGVSTGLLCAVLIHLWQGASLWLSVAVSLVVFPIAGWVWGAWMWRWAERRGDPIEVLNA